MQIRDSKFHALFDLQDDVRRCRYSDEWSEFRKELALIDKGINILVTNICRLDQEAGIIARDEK